MSAHRAFENFSTRKKILLGVYMPLLFILVLGTSSFINVNRITDRAKMVNFTYEAMAKTDAVVAATVDMETGMRGYLLTGKQEFLKPYTNAEAKLFALLDDLKTTLSINPEQVARLDKAEVILKKWRDKVVEPLLMLRRNNPNISMDRISSAIVTAHGHTYVDEFREIMEAVKQEESRLIALRHEQNEAAVDLALIVILTCIVLSCAVAGFLASYVSRLIARPIISTTGNMERLADGDTSIEVENTHRRDEIGAMSRALEVLKQNRIQADELHKAQQAEQELKLKRSEKIERLVAQFEEVASSAVSKVAASATQLTQTASSVAQQMEDANMAAQSSSEDASSTTSNVQSVASAAEEMSATVKEISSQMQRANELVSVSVEKVSGAGISSKALSESSAKVKEVVELIANIANQINLLSLNATIESARAGEAGRGFAVVAGEVKNLANQTDSSIQEIEKVINEMRAASNQVIDSLNDIRQSVDEITEVSGSVASAVEEQSVTTNEIASNMQTAAQGTQSILTHIQSISQGIATSKDASHEVQTAAQELTKQANTLDEEIKSFLNEIRAA